MPCRSAGIYWSYMYMVTYRRPVPQPVRPGGAGEPDGRSPMATAKGWMGSHGIYGHLPDHLHAWDHPDTFLGCVQVRSMRLWGDYVFSEGSASDRRKASRASANQIITGFLHCFNLWIGHAHTLMSDSPTIGGVVSERFSGRVGRRAESRTNGGSCQWRARLGRMAWAARKRG